MSLYAVKNDEGYYWDFLGSSGFWSSEIADPTTTIRKYQAEKVADETGGHVVELVEVPAKVVLTKEQAKIVEKANKSKFPATHISNNTGNSLCLEKLLMDACVNGYTVAKEKKYYVKVPFVKAQGGLWFLINSDDKLDATYIKELAKKFTMNEIEENGLQDCEKEEVTDDDD